MVLDGYRSMLPILHPTAIVFGDNKAKASKRCGFQADQSSNDLRPKSAGQVEEKLGAMALLCQN